MRLEKAPYLDSRKIFTVSELTYLIKDLLENFYDILLEGEVSNIRIPPSGHIYFTLKDEEAQIKAVIFRSSSIYLPYLPQNGRKVIVRGRVTVYEKRGEYQIVVTDLIPAGLGELHKRFEELKRKLEREGLFDKVFKKEIPLYPEKIGVITSPSGAAIRDILKVLGRRFPSIPVIIYPVHVQGERAASEIIKALDYMGKRNDIDVIILGRGGGSIEDLWVFNEEVVARAIFRCPIPIISAVGHEIDYTIADYVADKRAPTPSAAAEMVVRDRKEVLAEINNYRKRITSYILNRIEREKNNIDHLRNRLKDPVRILDNMKMRFSELYDRLFYSVWKLVEGEKYKLWNTIKFLINVNPMSNLVFYLDSIKRARADMVKSIANSLKEKQACLTSLLGRLENLDPMRILKRGYAIVKKPDGKVVYSYEDVEPGEEISVILGKGWILGRVEKTYNSKAN